jgi:hypothetical protein
MIEVTAIEMLLNKDLSNDYQFLEEFNHLLTLIHPLKEYFNKKYRFIKPNEMNNSELDKELNKPRALFDGQNWQQSKYRVSNCAVKSKYNRRITCADFKEKFG